MCYVSADLFLVTCFTLPLLVSSQNFQLTSSCGGSVETGDNCTLTCNTGNQQATVSWRDGSTLPYSPNDRPDCTGPASLPSYYITACPSSTTFTLTINNANYTRDSRTWTCQAYFGGSDSNTINITVTYAPSKPAILPPGALCEGQPVTLTCSSQSPGNPPPIYYWTKGHVAVETGSTYSFIPGRSDHTVKVRCAAGNMVTDQPGQTRPVSDSLELNVYYFPRMSTSPAIAASILKEERLVLLCSAESNPRNPAMTWSFKGTVLPGSRFEKTNMKTSDQGEYICTGTAKTRSVCPGGVLQSSSVVNVTVYSSVPIPGELQAWSPDATSIKLSWRISRLSGIYQQFHVEYKQTGDTWKTIGEIVNQTDDLFAEATVDSLNSNTMYLLRVQALTEFGHSEFTDEVRVITKGSSSECSQCREGSTPIVLFSVGLVLMIIALILIAVFVVIMVRMKRSSKRDASKQYATFQPGEENTYQELQERAYENTGTSPSSDSTGIQRP